MTFIDLTVNDTQREQNLTDLMTNAIEGGMTTGWARVNVYRWNAPYAERRAVLVDHEDGTEYTITPDLMAEGLRRWYEAMPTRKTECGEALALLVNTIDGEDFGFGFDAIDADICLQYAVLGDLIYG